MRDNLPVSQRGPRRPGHCWRRLRREAPQDDQRTTTGTIEFRWHARTVASARSLAFDLVLRIETQTTPTRPGLLW